MPPNDDGDDDAVGGVPPPPPDDRLWRHPSEVLAFGAGRLSRTPAPSPATVSRAPVWPIALVAGLVGAALCGGVLAVTGNLSVESRHVVEKVAMTPIVPSPFVPDERGVGALTERVSPAVVRLSITTSEGRSQASGVVYRDDGILLTSAHEVATATAITVVLSDGRRVDGELVGADLPTDVAVVSIDADGLTVAVMGTSSEVEVGLATMAVGCSWDGEAAVATGVVSALGRRLDSEDGSLHGLIQTDAPIEAAWSGGPLVDGSGAVIGITTDLAGDRVGFGFATPIDLVRVLADELMATGRVVHGWLGIEGVDLSDGEAEAMDLPGGAAVRRVMPGSPAAQVGLAPDDVITEVGDQQVGSSSDLVVALRLHKPGEKLMLGYWRNGRHQQVEVTIDEHP